MQNIIQHSCNIKCPKCNHIYLYSFKIDDIQKSTHKKGSIKNLFKFLTYLICKNPLCNYDMEIRGEAIVNSPDAIDLLKISSIK